MLPAGSQDLGSYISILGRPAVLGQPEPALLPAGHQGWFGWTLHSTCQSHTEAEKPQDFAGELTASWGVGEGRVPQREQCIGLPGKMSEGFP